MRDHVLDTDNPESCWCRPEVEQPCSEALDERCPDDCWRCGGNYFVEPWTDEIPSLVTHREPQAQLWALWRCGPYVVLLPYRESSSATGGGSSR